MIDSFYMFSSRKHFVCHRSSFNKGTRSKDENCEANLKVKIKINNAHTRYNDPYLKVRLSAVRASCICIVY